MNICTWNEVVGKEELKIFWKVAIQINWKTYSNHIETSFQKINKHTNLPTSSIMYYVLNDVLCRFVAEFVFKQYGY
jgi:hypothetical protein